MMQNVSTVLSKIVATELEKDSNHNKNNQLKGRGHNRLMSKFGPFLSYFF